MRLKIIVVSFALLISIPAKSELAAQCNFNTSEYISELSDLKYLENIEITVYKYKKWTTNLMKALLDKKGAILPKYKKKFDAKIISRYKFGECIHEGEIRLHGDWKDHIDFDSGSFIQSLDVSLISGSIARFTKFKLFLPETRKFENEILLTSILRSLDFLAPRTSITKVSVNGKQVDMLIQEKVSKEMLESQKRREGPIYEGEEKYHFNNFRDFQHYQLKGISLSKMTNSKWSEINRNTSNISINALIQLQTIYSQFANSDSNTYGLNSNLLSNGSESLNNKWAMYEILLYAANSSHALIPHNRKFYYNSFYQGFEPIYYDGNVRSLKGSWIRPRPDYRFYPYLALENFIYLESLIGDIDTEEFINKYIEVNDLISAQELQLILNDISEKITKLKSEFLEYNAKNESEYFPESTISIQEFTNNIRKYLQDGFLLKFVNKYNDQHNINYEICSIEAPTFCYEREIPLIELGKLLEEKNIEGISKKSPIIILPSLMDRIPEKKSEYLNGKIKIKSSINTDIEFNEDSNEISVKMNDVEDWILIYDSDLSNIKVRISSDIHNQDNVIPNISRIDKNGFTGCLSIFNSILKSTILEAENLFNRCEDSINIVRSVGHLSEVNINYASSDALDIDFSNLILENLNISNAGNDCADFSYGNYVVKESKIRNCKDKGISVGEKSDIKLENITINGATIGVSSKDSSNTTISNGNIENSIICIESYQKKQEFVGSVLSVDNINCNDSKTNKGNNSIINHL